MATPTVAPGKTPTLVPQNTPSLVPSPSFGLASAPGAPSVEIPTPRWLAGSAVLAGVLAVVFVIAAILGVREHRGALDTIVNSSAKSVVAAQRIASALADMDANAANSLLSPLQKQAAIKSYTESRILMSEALVDAAHNITFSGEELEIKSLASGGTDYSARVESAFTLQAGGSAGSTAQYIKAAQLMDSALMPSARKLDQINRDELDKTYRGIQNVSLIQKILVWLTGLAMLAVLIRMQVYLSDRMRRTLNPLCLASTLLVAGLLLYTSHALSESSRQIDAAKLDAFQSIHLLWQAKAVGYEANALESRYLLDQAGAASYATRFVDATKKMSSDAAVLASRMANSDKPTADMKGFLADELRNVTYPGERESALAAATWWARYVEIDRQIRAFEQAGNHNKAIELCLGDNANQSNWAFNGFIQALDTTLSINQKEFDKAADLGLAALKNFEIIAPVVALLAALACFLGVWPRIREYSV